MNKKIATIAGLAIAASGATADVLLEIDLSVANEVTISATSGLASVSASASNFTGFLLADFFANAGGGGSPGSGVGNLSTFGNASDASPALFVGGTSFGLNIWSFSSDTDVDVVGGEARPPSLAAFSFQNCWS